MADDDDSFSSDSDDEFLMRRQQEQANNKSSNSNSKSGSTTTSTTTDREAMIRKKLLESFYGKSAILVGDDAHHHHDHDADGATAKRRGSRDDDSSDSGDSSDDDDDYDDHDRPSSSATRPAAGRGAGARGATTTTTTGMKKNSSNTNKEEDLDAPQFNAAAHTRKHVFQDGVHPLLELEEGLACQVRTLDSSLQTLVYENYSRFIEATDAIRSIGVQTNQLLVQGGSSGGGGGTKNNSKNNNNTSSSSLTEQLQANMQVVSDASRSVEMAVGPLRDQVVEKLRIQRLLQRLDTVLKLPTTLRQQIAAGQYRLATQAHVSAIYSILSKHSAGFESLQRIETECHAIMTQLLQEVRHKLIHWSGGIVPSSSSSRHRRRGGGGNRLLMQGNSSDDEGEDMDGQEEKDLVDDNDDDDEEEEEEEDYDGPLPDPPQSIAEIMACAGTPVLILLLQQQQESNSSNTDATSSTTPQQEHHPMGLDPRLTLEDCQEMATSASLRFLERILDSHHIELQEQQILLSSSSSLSDPMTTTTTTKKKQTGSNTQGAGAGGEDTAPTVLLNLVPTSVLDNILEVSTLYTRSFLANKNNDKGQPKQQQQQQPLGDERLAQFVSTAFGNFLQHVRGELVEQAMLQQQQASQARAAAQKAQKTTAAASAAAKTRHTKTPSQDAAELRLFDAEEQCDQYDEQIAAAMATLVLSVRQLASGLSMIPHGAIAPELASSLVDQTVGLTEAMVRRRVDQKFDTLRLRVIEDCLAPFCRAVQELSTEEAKEEHQTPPLLGAVQLASVALSDSLQLVDDTVRSILTTLDDTNKNNSDEDGDDSMLREAVEYSTKRFARWLASAMEQLAGYESSSDPNVLLQAAAVRSDNADEDTNMMHHAASPSYGESSSFMAPNNNKAVHHVSDDDRSQMSAAGPSDGMVETELLDLVNSSAEPTFEMVLAIAEMCRIAERSVMENILQSISTHGGASGPISGSGVGSGGIPKRKAAARGDGLFSGDEQQQQKNRTKNPISERFRLAASRVLSLFAMNRGNEAATLLCSSLPDLSIKSTNGTMSVEGPRPVVSQVLELAKATSLDCADLFGGKRRAGPIPDTLEDEYASLTSSRMNSGTSNRSGLAFDVERMFAEKVVIYPHPNDVADFHLNAVLALVFKVGFKAMIENARLVRFSISGYRQLKVDVEFLKWILPHYIKDEALSDGSNARTALNSLLTEAIQTAKDRCAGVEELYQEVEEVNQARSTIRQYMSSIGRPSFCITED